MSQMTQSPSSRSVNLVQVLAGSAAAATAAVVTSVLGVAGTIVGAAIVSAAMSVLAAVYDHSLRRARDQLRVSLPRADSHTLPVSNGQAHDGEAGPVLETLHLEDARGYRWGHIALASLMFFVLAMAAITGLEALTGKPVSCVLRGSECTGTSVSRLIDGDRQSVRPTPRPSPSQAPPATRPTSIPETEPTTKATVTVTETPSPPPSPSEVASSSDG